MTRMVYNSFFSLSLLRGEGGARVLGRAHMTASSHTFKSERLRETESDQKRPMIFIVYISKREKQ